MKKKFFGFLSAVLAFVVLGGTAFVAADENLQKTDSAYAATASTLYLKPNSNWTQAGARFAAYFFDNGETWDSMTDAGDGYYKVAVPTSKTYPSVIFCRMNPGTSTNNWDNKWDQTKDLTIPTDGKNCYTVKEGAWSKGDGTWSFKDAAAIDITSANGNVVAVGQSIKFEYSYRNSSTAPTNVTWESNKTSVATVDTNGNVTGVSAGSVTITASADGFVQGKYDLTVSNLQKGLQLYFKPHNEWKSDDARFAVYFFGNGDTWASMTDSNADGVFEFNTPTDKFYSSLIFVRMNPSVSTNSWDNKWGAQTENLSYNGVDNLFTVEKDQWGDSAKGTWSTYYTAATLALKIESLAGDFIDSKTAAEITDNCGKNYAEIKDLILKLTSVELNVFKTSEDEKIALARTTYEHWCYVNEDANPYSGSIVNGANIALNFVNDNSIYLIVIFALVGMSIVGFVLLKKKRVNN